MRHEWAHLVIAHRGGDNGSAETGRDADADATDGTANGDVPNHIFLTIPCRDVRWAREEGEEERRTLERNR